MATPNYDAVNNLLDLWRETNVVTDYLYTYLFLLTFFIIAYMVMQNWDPRHVFTASSLATSLIAMLLFLAQLVPVAAFVVALLVFTTSLMYLLFGSSE